MRGQRLWLVVSMGLAGALLTTGLVAINDALVRMSEVPPSEITATDAKQFAWRALPAAANIGVLFLLITFVSTSSPQRLTVLRATIVIALAGLCAALISQCVIPSGKARGLSHEVLAFIVIPIIGMLAAVALIIRSSRIKEQS